jgi:inhibitor of KinA sporulation pathway (predicted exonuclease)
MRGFCNRISDSLFVKKKGVVYMSVYHIVLDLEMNPVSALQLSACNGLKTETIEFGAIKIDASTNQIVDEYSCVVCPEFNHRIEPEITRLTGITSKEVRTAKSFHTALSDFISWIGCDNATIFSWSPSDYSQLRKECNAKHIAFPTELVNWVDFQAEYPKYLGYSLNKCFSLKEAAGMVGTTFISSRAHRALYDAQITAKLVLFALTGEYKHYTNRISNMIDSSPRVMTYSIGDTCGGKLTALLTRLNSSTEREVF